MQWAAAPRRVASLVRPRQMSRRGQGVLIPAASRNSGLRRKAKAEGWARFTEGRVSVKAGPAALSGQLQETRCDGSGDLGVPSSEEIPPC